MSELQKEFPIGQLVALAIGSPEAGNVNFNLLQKVLVEILKLTDIEDAKIKISSLDAKELDEASQAVTPRDEEDSGKLRGHQCPIDPEKVDQLLEDVNQLKFDVEDLINKVGNVSATADTVPVQAMRASLSQVDELHEKVKKLEAALESVKEVGSVKDERGVGERVLDLEKSAKIYDEQLFNINTLLETKLQYIIDHFDDVEKELGALNEKVNTSASSRMSVQASHRRITSVGNTDIRASTSEHKEQAASNINNMLSRLSSVQHDLDNLTMVTTNLREDQEQKQMSIDVLTEQIEVLKTGKADKVNVDDILAAKADLSHVHRKVSHDHFVTKMDEFNQMLEDAFSRLDAHEDLWQDEVEVIKGDIEQKLDKLEFDPLKVYVNEKLKVLQDKMKSLAAQRREQLAAGSKKRIIRDVQCISCDENVIMKQDNTMEDMMPSPPLPAQPSVKPYLTYQLDQVRKQQKKLPGGRNMNHFEKMLSECGDQKLQKGHSSLSPSGEHLANRYVGGSHTITTPQQRVTRTGNFFQTWGPVITAVKTPQATAT